MAATGMTRIGNGSGREPPRVSGAGHAARWPLSVKVARAGTSVDLGPPLGRETYDRAAIIVDYFLGTAAKYADTATLDAVQEIVSSDAPDPVALRRIDWELAPFYCPDCDLNYCRADWDTYVLVDEGFYDCTMGICPNGHRHMVDD